MRSKLFALVDCNNFFVSCERIFNPRLANKPVIVLSSNDGCVVARSNEAKALNIPMGAPVYQHKLIIRKHQVQVLSSNFSLYRDMSYRVMACLKSFSPDCEIYSIDEAFIRLDLLADKDYEAVATQMRKTVMQWTGIPVSIGLAMTKTLAKIANRYAKKHTLTGVHRLYPDNQDGALQQLSLEDIWGIAQRTATKLRQLGIENALHLKNADLRCMKKHFGVVMERMIWELRGTPCLDLEKPSPKKSIQSSRSFGELLVDFKSIAEALANYAATACEKLRAQNSLAQGLCVFIKTSAFRTNEVYYSNQATLRFEIPTDDTGLIMSRAIEALKTIFKPGYKYTKTGILLLELVDAHYRQASLFAPIVIDTKRQHLNRVVDTINGKIGDSAVFRGAQGGQKSWQTRCHRRSPRYSTHWNELVNVY